MEHQEHFGRKFYLDKKTGYWISTDYPRVRAHAWVWINQKGEIPKGMQIHHIDENKSNNNIDNLMIISASDHMKLHMTKERIDLARKWVDIIRPMTKEWHASKEGRQWHKEHGKKCWDKREYKNLSCNQCKKSFSTKTYHQTFCSNACKSAWRRAKGYDDIEVGCLYCGNKFKRNKYAKRRFCSRKCCNIFQSKECK